MQPFKTAVAGFPRIGEKRELKFVLEEYWSGKCDFLKVEATAKALRTRHWNYQKDAGIDLVSVNDFSLYDTTLDMTVALGAIPARFRDIDQPTARYFAMARGDTTHTAMAMTKWFNTNYHYIVPELSDSDAYRADASKIAAEYAEAKALGITPKINIIGPVTFWKLSRKEGDETAIFDKLLATYVDLLEQIAKLDDEVFVQIDEPALVADPTQADLSLAKIAYEKLGSVDASLKLILTTYFEHAKEAVEALKDAPIYAFGLDFVHGKENLELLDTLNASGKHLIAGVVNGRNIWANDLHRSKEILDTLAKKLGKQRITVSSSCSLLHSPYTTEYETKLSPEIKERMSFANEKLDEISLVSKLFRDETKTITVAERILLDRYTSWKKRGVAADPAVAGRLAAVPASLDRSRPFYERIAVQRKELGYPDLATTTIGSFPQTPELRATRRAYKEGSINQAEYEAYIEKMTDECIAVQEEADIDVLVHGEFERNDMVEYFGQQLSGYAFSLNGWVQSYGSRCVKPPIIHGDVSRPEAMTVRWITYAQSQTDRLVKGMLTGPATMLNWSFVREDIPREVVMQQMALAIGDEVADLQNAGIKIIQVDEAAFKEGYPLRKAKRAAYETMAVDAFKLAVLPAKDETQIHTHMCYSDFTDIMPTIEAMDADVITIETSRNGNVLLEAFKAHGYQKEVGPGVYDIHSPRVPSVEEMEAQIKALLEVLPKKQLWINPDCGLKTRKYDEVIPSLKNMVQAVKNVRESLN